MDQKIDQKKKARLNPRIQEPNDNPEKSDSCLSTDMLNAEESDKSEKLRSTVCLDREVLEKAKRYNIKVSRVCNTFLRTFLDYYERGATTLQGQSQGKGMDQQVIMRKLLLDLFV